MISREFYLEPRIIIHTERLYRSRLSVAMLVTERRASRQIATHGERSLLPFFTDLFR